RQRLERDARIVDTPRAGKAQRRDALGPDRVEQEIEPGGLQEQARMPNEGDAPGVVVDLSGRTIVVGARPSLGPKRPRSGQPPADQIEDAARLRSLGIEEPRAIEMIRHRTIVVARHCTPPEESEERGGGEGAQRSNDAAARSGHPQSRSARTTSANNRA